MGILDQILLLNAPETERFDQMLKIFHRTWCLPNAPITRETHCLLINLPLLSA